MNREYKTRKNSNPPQIDTQKNYSAPIIDLTKEKITFFLFRTLPLYEKKTQQVLFTEKKNRSWKIIKRSNLLKDFTKEREKNIYKVELEENEKRYYAKNYLK